MKPVLVKLDEIRIDGGTQMRVRLDEDHVADLSENVAELPAAILFFDGTDHWMADGFHRYFARKQSGYGTILAEVREGTKRDAIRFAIGANKSHGLKRSNADKRKAVTAMLADEEWAELSDRAIAEECGVTHPFVAEVRKSRWKPLPPEPKNALSDSETPPEPAESKPRTGRDGKKYPANPKPKAEATPAPEAAKPTPPAPIPEPPKRKNGAEVVGPKDRKAALAAFGKLIRIMHKWPGYYHRIEPHFDAILKEIQPGMKEGAAA